MKPVKIFKTKNGEKVNLYTIGTLASELGRTAQTIRKWEVAGILPKAIFKDNNGKRLYSEEQIQCIVDIAEKCNVRQGYSVANTSFPSKVHEALQELNKKYY